jgi:hypothetical protein
MDFDIGSLLASMIIGGAGFVAFVYGKKQTRLPHMVAGVVLMVYPYFVSSVWLMFAIAVAILASLYGVVRLGW